MATDNDPPSSPPPPDAPPPADPTGIQTTPTAPAGIQLNPFPSAPSAPPPPTEEKPKKRRLTPNEVARIASHLDKCLVAVVLVLAFFLASFAVRNSDFWMHLATGRLLANGQYTFGVDPFAYTTEGVYWANHSWLFDLGLYGLWQAAGGEAVVVVKAVLITLLAVLMLLVRRPGQGLWAPAACTALALIALSPRLLLQPAILSYLFLGLTLWLLTAKQRAANGDDIDGTTRRPFGLRLACFVLLFVLWVNLDGWFLLGPLTVGLFLAGECLQEYFAPVRVGPDASRARDRLELLAIFAAGLAACLLSPHHVHAFTLPPELSPAVPRAVLKEDSSFQRFFYTPFNEAYYYHTRLGLSLAAVAYPVLVVVSLASFAVNRHGFRWWRALIWLVFLALSLFQARAVPFFAVVAGPIAALNWQDFAAHTFGMQPRSTPGWRYWSLGGRIGYLVAGLLLLAAAWPGWLHFQSSDRYAARSVAWTVEPDPAMQRTAETIRQWRLDGKLTPEDRGLHLSPDFVNYCAWFCADEAGRPLEKGFFDARLQLFGPVAADYVRARQALNPDRMLGDAELLTLLTWSPETTFPANLPLAGLAVFSQNTWAYASGSWRNVLREQKVPVCYVVVGPDLTRTQTSLQLLLAGPNEWALLHPDGRSAILGWRDPTDNARATAIERLRFVPGPLAFGPQPVRAPERGPGRAPNRGDWWEPYTAAPGPRGVDADTASLLLTYCDLTKYDWQLKQRNAWRASQGERQRWGSYVAGLVGFNCAGMKFLPTAAAYGWRSSYLLEEPAIDYRLPGDPALPILAVRAARRAVAADPDDPRAHWRLVQAYQMLDDGLESPWAGGRVPAQRASLRQLQILAAAQRTAGGKALNTQDHLVCGQAHLLLFDTFLRAGYNDLALAHLTDGIEHLRAADTAFAGADKQLPDLEKVRNELLDKVGEKTEEREAGEVRKKYNVAAKDQPFARRVELALSEGLVKLALELLAQATPEEQRQPIRQQSFLDVLTGLLLKTGRVDELRGILLDAERKGLLGGQYEMLKAQVAAADGSYRDAGDHLDEVLKRMAKFNQELPFNRKPPFNPRGTRSLVEVTVEELLLLADVVPAAAWLKLPQLNAMNQAVFRSLAAEAEMLALRGLLALEEGDNETAARYLDKALNLRGLALNFPDHVVAFRYLALLHEYGVKVKKQ